MYAKVPVVASLVAVVRTVRTDSQTVRCSNLIRSMHLKFIKVITNLDY